MKTKLPLLILMLLLATSVHAQSAPDPSSWKRYTITDEEFSVTLPTLPAMRTYKGFSQRLNKERLERYVTASADRVTYAIQTYENPNREQSFADFLTERTADYQKEVSTARDLMLNGFPGREHSYREADRRGTEQFFATEDHFYRFFVYGAVQDHPGVRRFFASITLGKNQNGSAVSDGPGVRLETATGLDEKVYLAREVDRKVKLQKRPHPDYPDLAKRNGVRGTVILMAVFNSNGKVTRIRVKQGLPHGLTEKAIEAARKIKFTPAIKDGNPVSVWTTLEYNFNLF